MSGMSEASAANPDEGAEPCEATEERQLGVRRCSFSGFSIIARDKDVEGNSLLITITLA